MTKQEMYNEIKSRQLKTAEILDKIAFEKRELSNVERVTVDGYAEEIKEYERQMKTSEVAPKRVLESGAGISDDNFTLTSFLRNLADNKSFNDIEKDVIEMGKREMKNSGQSFTGTVLPLNFHNRATLQAGTSVVGSELVATEKFDLLMPLRAKSVLAKAGATIMSNLVGNFSVPIMTGSTAGWKGENITAGDGVNGFLTKEYSAKRLTVYLPVSRQLLIQNSVDAERKLQLDLVNAINQKLEETLLGSAAGDSTKPAGIFYGVSTTGDTTWANVVNLETTINANNADVDNMCYIVHPTVLGKMKTTAKNATYGSTYIAENSLINGYKFYTTTNLPTISGGKGTVFGNFAEMYVNFWNGMDIVVDNLTGAKEGIVNYIINLYCDGGVVRSDSFAKISLV
jgi:HK97 family phage major capsid protein